MAITFTGSTISGGISVQNAPTVALWSWGYNYYGEVGVNTVSGFGISSPVQVGSTSAPTWTIVRGSATTVAGVKSDGTLWAWGYNANGSGVGDVVNRSSPTQVGALTTWLSIGAQGAAYTGSTFAVKTDGTLWAWGSGATNSLGNGGTANVSSPVQVGANLTSWSGGQLSALGSALGAGITNTGQLYTWGDNQYGQLGINTRTQPGGGIQTVSGTNWSKVTTSQLATIAIRTDGTLWAWGYGGYGTLGIGTVTNRSSPTQVGILNNWSTVSGTYGGVVALKTDGTIWEWGFNGPGTSYRSSPVQIGSVSTWNNVSSHLYGGIATKTDGTLWLWGKNNYGQLGNNNTADNQTPQQLGSLTTWGNSVMYGGFSVHVVSTT